MSKETYQKALKNGLDDRHIEYVKRDIQKSRTKGLG